MAALALLATLPAGAFAADVPSSRTLTQDGPTGRYSLSGGGWLFRSDPRDRGLRQHIWRRGSGWHRVSVPNAWNANDLSNSSMRGGVVWYRKDFRLPASASDWIVRFENVRYRATVFLNGKRIGSHAGAWLPWELHLRGVKRTNRLVVRVDNRMHEDDIPQGKETNFGAPNGGWWNWGGILGEVYLRRVNGIDISSAQVLPRLSCRTCDARIDYRVTVHNYRRRAATVRVTSTFGDQPVTVGMGRVRGGGSRRFTGSLRVHNPHLWSPTDPHLYPVSISASGGGSAGWTLNTGIRSITTRGGILMLNYRPTHFRGVFLHEDGPGMGGAITPARNRLFVSLAHQIGATVFRTHYPLNPYLHELADREGIMIWSEIPVFQMHTSTLREPAVRRKAYRMLRTNILANGNHPSVLAWSLGNELNAHPEMRSVGRYFREATGLAHGLDPTRPVAYATQGYPGAGCQRAYAPFDLLGINIYFGWYPGPFGTIADRDALSSYLNKAHRCYRSKAIAVTEFGAEGNRNGPPEDRGTYQFQADINDFDLQTFATKPWLGGAIGMLIEFRVRPGWSGGNPYPSSPMHQKAVFDFFGRPKPAAAVLSRWYHQTPQWEDTLPGT